MTSLLKDYESWTSDWHLFDGQLLDPLLDPTLLDDPLDPAGFTDSCSQSTDSSGGSLVDAFSDSLAAFQSLDDDDVMSVLSSTTSWSCVVDGQSKQHKFVTETESDIVCQQSSTFNLLPMSDDKCSPILLPTEPENFDDIGYLTSVPIRTDDPIQCDPLLDPAVCCEAPDVEIVDCCIEEVDICQLSPELHNVDDSCYRSDDDMEECPEIIPAETVIEEDVLDMDLSAVILDMKRETVSEEPAGSGGNGHLSCDVLETLFSSWDQHQLFQDDESFSVVSSENSCGYELVDVTEDGDMLASTGVGFVDARRRLRKLRKKEQNKTAASKYREKKRTERGQVLSEFTVIERRNSELKARITDMSREIRYLRSLISELCP